MQPAAVDGRVHPQLLACLELDRHLFAGSCRKPDHPRSQLQRRPTGLRGAGERAQEGHRVGHRLTRHAQRAVPLESCLDAIAVRVCGKSGHGRLLLLAARAQPRAAAPHLHAQLAQQLLA